jgi:hypothetical protein
MSKSKTTPALPVGQQRLVRLDSDRYRLEKIEAYNVAIEALRAHESADPDPDGLDRKLRHRLADKLDREIQRWVDSLPNIRLMI